MSERREIFLLVGVTLAIGIIAMVLITYTPTVDQPEVFAENYEATFHPNGTLTEEYTYHLKTGGYHFLFRLWEAPLSFQDIGYRRSENPQ